MSRAVVRTAVVFANSGQPLFLQMAHFPKERFVGERLESSSVDFCARRCVIFLLFQFL